MNFLAIRVILEMKSTMEKGSSLKNPTGGLASSSTTTTTPQADFGISGFVGGTESNEVRGSTMPSPQPAEQEEEPTFKPVDIVIERPSKMSVDKTTLTTKNCIVCESVIPKQAKFCSKCGNSQ
jgi:hypothetical protein